MSDDIAQLGFNVKTSGLTKGEKALKSYAKTGDKVEASIDANVSSMNSSFNGLSTAIGVASTALAAMGLSQLSSDVIQYSDAWLGLDSQLKQVTDSELELMAVREKLLEVSRDTRSELTGTIGLYSDLWRSTKDMNLTSSELIDVVTTINQLFLAGGKSAAEAAGAITQLNQGLAAGALRGDEFNSVAEGAPKIMDALAASLSMSRGELRDFAATGGITSSILVSSLQDYSDTAELLASKTNTTFGQMTTVAKTNVTEFVGNSEALNSAAQTAGETILSLSTNISSLVAAVESGAYVIGVGYVASLTKSTAATIAQVSADAAAVTSANAAGVARATLAGKAAAAATVMAASEVEIAEARIASVTSSIAALDAETALEAERMRAQITSTGQVQSATRLAEIRTAQLAMTKQLTAAEIQLSAANSKAATTEAALATATTGVATAQRAATSTTLALRSATSFLLGPWGLLITAVGIAATTFISTKSESDSLEESLRNQKSAVNELITEYEKMSNAAMGSAYISAQKTLIELDQQRLDINKKINEVAAAGGEGSYGVILSLKAQLEDLDTASIGAEQRLEAIQEIFNNGIEAISWSEPVEAAAESVAGLTGKISSLSYEVSKSPYQAWLEEITDASTLTQIENLKDEIEAVWMAAQYGDIDQDDALDYIDQLKDKLESLQGTADDVDLLGNASDSINAGISSLQSMASTGSTAYATLSAASDAYAAYQAINAVLTQGEGDPYTAFARMAAMAATVSSLGQSISGITGGSDSSYDSDTIQSEQGTDAYGDDYTSIVDSVEDTADATEDLVGINTDMLDALEDLTDSLTGAASISVDSILGASIEIGSSVSSISSIATSLFDGVDSLFSALTFGLTDGWISDIGSSIFGGDTSSVDEGVKIIGGTLSDLIEESAVYAYETIKTSGGWFSSSSYDTYSTYAEEASDQFSLVFASLYDSVYEAGSLLGMSDDYLSSVLSDYVIDTFSVSLDGLDDDEAAEELEAVFSEIFNDLAEEVIPWISDFQDAGEELATTLTRLAVEVSLLEYASDTLGFSLGDLADDAYDLTSSADALADYFDSTEDLSDAISSFISDFADDSTLLDLYGSAMTDALDEVGLSLPTSSDGFWDLMESLDASTDSGLEQIATLLELTDTASEYYDLLEDTQSEMADLSDTFAGAVADIYDVTDATEQMSLDAALAAAQLGDFSLAEALDVSDYTLDTDDYSSLADYNIAQAEVANKLMEIAELSAAEAGDVETEQLDELKAINESIIVSITETNALLSANYKIAMESNEYLDVINNKTEYAA